MCILLGIEIFGNFIRNKPQPKTKPFTIYNNNTSKGCGQKHSETISPRRNQVPSKFYGSVYSSKNFEAERMLTLYMCCSRLTEDVFFDGCVFRKQKTKLLKKI